MAASVAAATSSRPSASARRPCSSDAPTRGRSARQEGRGSRAPSTSCARTSYARCGCSAAPRYAVSTRPTSTPLVDADRGLRAGAWPGATRGIPALRLHHRSIEPDDVVPAQDLLGPIEQLRVTPTRTLEKKLLDAIGRGRRDVAQDVEHLLLPGDLRHARILRRIELRVGRHPLVADAVLVPDVQLEMLAARRLEHPVLGIDGWSAPPAARRALHREGGRR